MLVERATYTPYGAVDSDYRPSRWQYSREDYKFTGKEEDVELGISYFGARYYSPYLGRFMSPDPLTIHGLAGDLNPYAYVGGRATGEGSQCSEGEVALEYDDDDDHRRRERRRQWEQRREQRREQQWQCWSRWRERQRREGAAEGAAGEQRCRTQFQRATPPKAPSGPSNAPVHGVRHRSSQGDFEGAATGAEIAEGSLVAGGAAAGGGKMVVAAGAVVVVVGVAVL